MFEQLFGSKTRVRLMRLFLENPEKKYFVRELTRVLGSLINSVRRELENLVEIGFVLVEDAAIMEPGGKKTINAKKYYYLNQQNAFREDLLNLFDKERILEEKRLLERIKELGEVKFLSLVGYFADDLKAETDILVVGDFDKEQCRKLFSEFEKEVEKPIRFTIMDEDEFTLRKSIADRFLDDILNRDGAIVVVDKISKKTLQQS